MNRALLIELLAENLWHSPTLKGEFVHGPEFRLKLAAEAISFLEENGLLKVNDINEGK